MSQRTGNKIEISITVLLFITAVGLMVGMEYLKAI